MDSPRPLLEAVADLTATLPSRPSWDDYFMATALLIATRSPCERLHVGCVIVSGGSRKNRIVAAGYNGFLPGTAHVSRLRDGHEQGTVHAEQNAVADAARRGSSVEGCVAYVSHYPCISCAKILAAAGIAEVRYHRDYNNDPLVRPLLEESGVRIIQL
ncbi:deoxycytidylate deaminase [Nibricoccus sp. IMCC34717]|uniref:deoxycytidylate deaminase n=1 Tax=Nibricoccus sp. IMCC34717 TaxID=3034021 RepID=UPI00384B41C5